MNWTSSETDFSFEQRPSAARIYNYLLGGYHNFEVDRQVATRLLQQYPELTVVASVNRAFLRRAVLYLLEKGITQFLDIGSGLPTLGNVHEVVDATLPAANARSSGKVVYVDIDPVAVAHGQSILRDSPNACAIMGDLCQPQQILSHPLVMDRLNLQQPIGLLLIAVLHYVNEDTATFAAVDELRAALAPGSYMVISHTAKETESAGSENRRLTYQPVSSTRSRTYSEVLRYFGDFELVDPGLVYTPLWRPESAGDALLDRPEAAFTWAGIGRKLAREVKGHASLAL